ncbi:hypothetical protein [Rothia sp. HMSC065C03]|uniref:hypothetical protein n=1 Tax=Rothia sp. HMSC065C03 TaxID=1715084 RepID=UPI000AC1876A|nr:hypothetical protein [Rothia sp. HMSC065C03]
MCDWKPGPRCFTHYEPIYDAAKEKYFELLEEADKKAADGTLTDEDRLKLQIAFQNYQAAQRMFYMSPKARKKHLGSDILKARAALEEAQKYSDEHPNDKYAETCLANAAANLNQLEKQAVDGNHRWQQAKLASELAARRNENALERGIFSEATYTEEDLEDIDLNTWDRACPDGTITLHGFDDKLKKSSDPKIYREATITRKVRIELPTGERVHVDLQARIIQKKKGSSSYTVEYTVHYKGQNLGTLIPNSTAQDGYYGVGAVAEHRPVTRDTADSARDGGRSAKPTGNTTRRSTTSPTKNWPNTKQHTKPTSKQSPSTTTKTKKECTPPAPPSTDSSTPPTKDKTTTTSPANSSKTATPTPASTASLAPKMTSKKF